MPPTRQFLDTLRELREGTTLTELDAQLTELVAAVRDSGRPGKLTLTLTVKPAAKGNVNVLALEDVITLKKPAAERGTTVLFAAADNTLSRRDPRQPELSGLRQPTPIRTAAAADGAPGLVPPSGSGV